MSTFAERLKEKTQKLKEVEVKKLKPFLRKHFDIIENFIEEHKQVNISFAKQKGELVDIETKVYESLAKDLMETDFKEYKGYIINAENLAQYISQIRIEKDCKKQNHKPKFKENINNNLGSESNININKEQINTKNRSQKLVEDKVSSVSEVKIETGKGSQSALQIGNLSTEQAQSKGLILSAEEENIILNCSDTYFKYKKFLNTLDENANKDKRYGVHNEEINMEILVKTIYKMFEMEFPGTNIGVLSDGQKRSMRIANSNFSEGIKKIASQIWARNDLINLLIGRKNNKNLAVQTA